MDPFCACGNPDFKRHFSFDFQYPLPCLFPRPLIGTAAVYSRRFGSSSLRKQKDNRTPCLGRRAFQPLHPSSCVRSLAYYLISLDPRTGSRVYNLIVQERIRYKTGDLAKSAAISVDTIRYYERLHLLPTAARTASGYRMFPPEALQRLLLIRRALAIGFSIAELSGILQERDRGGAPCRTVRSLAGRKLEELEKQIREMKKFRNQLKSVIADWDTKIKKSGFGRNAHLLDSLTMNGDSSKHFSHKQKLHRRRK